MLADCLHDLTALGPLGLPALAATLFLAGLAGGVTHCVGMCAPFVLAQAAARPGQGGPLLQRLAGAALLPYQGGRVLGYAALGALVGGTAGAVARLGGAQGALALLLFAGALLMLGQALRQGAPYLPAPLSRAAAHLHLPGLRLPAALERRVAPLLAAPGGWRGFTLGLLLSALPCGLLYGALAAAAASGSALAGAIAMGAFALGTMPALVGLAALGRFFGRRHGRTMGAVGAGLFALNGVLLVAMATRLALAA
jgi:hypothetical protein